MQIEARYLEEVERLVKFHFPEVVGWYFGSRVKGNASEYSDLDISLSLKGDPLPIRQLALLKDDLTESDVPFKVDVVDWNSIDPEFRRVIKQQCVAYPYVQ